MIKYSEKEMMETNIYLGRLFSASTDVEGYLYYLVEEMLGDEYFCNLFPGQEICEELGEIRQKVQALNDMIRKLKRIQKQLGQEISYMRNKQRFRLEELYRGAVLTRSRYEYIAQTPYENSASLVIEQEEASYLYKLLSGKMPQSNRSSLGAISYCLKAQYHYREVIPE